MEKFKKTYELLGITRFSKQVIIENEKKEVVFRGGQIHPVLIPGKYTTTDTRIQEALEEDPSFNMYYKLVSSEKLEVEKPVVKEEIIEHAEELPKGASISVPDITNSQNARRWLADHFNVSEQSIGSLKADILAFAEEHEVVFPDWE